MITAVGQLNRPKIPPLPGLDAFRGPLFHSARWPADLDVTGKRVRSSAPGRARCRSCPRSPSGPGTSPCSSAPRSGPRPNDVYFSPIDDAASLLMEHVPFYRRWYRHRLSWNTGDRVHASLQKDPEWAHGDRSVNAVNDGHRRVFTRLPSAASWPGGTTWSRRRCRTTRRSASGCCSTTAGTRRSAATTSTSSPPRSPPSPRRRADRRTAPTSRPTSWCCARASRRQKLLWPLLDPGRGGPTIAEAWGPDDADAHLGITVRGFPNLFLTCGPGTVLGHGGSYITIAECQVRYIVEALVGMVENGLGAVEVLPEVHADYAARHDAAHAAMIWTHPGMRNWYRNPAGRVVCALPWRIVDHLEDDPARRLGRVRRGVARRRQLTLLNWWSSFSGPRIGLAIGGRGGAEELSATTRLSWWCSTACQTSPMLPG